VDFGLLRALNIKLPNTPYLLSPDMVVRDAGAYTTVGTGSSSWRAPKRLTKIEEGLQLRVVKVKLVR
jgi:hypothetical protein